jgi:hypothetical protein
LEIQPNTKIPAWRRGFFLLTNLHGWHFDTQLRQHRRNPAVGRRIDLFVRDFIASYHHNAGIPDSAAAFDRITQSTFLARSRAWNRQVYNPPFTDPEFWILFK